MTLLQIITTQEYYRRTSLFQSSITDAYIFVPLLVAMIFFILIIIVAVNKLGSKQKNINNAILIVCSFFMFANIIISVIFSYKKESLEKENQNVFEKNSIAYNTSIYRISNILNHRIRTEHPFKQPTKYYDINEYHYYLRLNNEPLKQFYLPPSLANTFFYLNTMKDGDSVRVSMTTFKGKEYLLSLEPL